MLLQDLRGQLDLSMNQLFNFMCEHNKAFLNFLIEKDIKLLNGVFSCIVKQKASIINFKNKRSYFRRALKKSSTREGPLKVEVKRNEVFRDSFLSIITKRPNEMRGNLKIKFKNERGFDEGGLAREWFSLLSKEIFNPNYALFKPISNQATFQPNPHSNINPDHCRYFKFIGRVVGKALQEGFLFEAFFTSSFYKHMCGETLNIKDMEHFDETFYKNLEWIRTNDITGLDLNFCYTVDNFGEVINKELIPGGEQVMVTNENK